MAAGVKCEIVHGDLTAAERAAVLRRFETGETQASALCWLPKLMLFNAHRL